MTNNKKVIFIGGTSRSGSTLLDKIISNDSKAVSLGEIHVLFHPTRTHHFKLREELKKDKRWNIILKEGKRRLFDNLIKYFPTYNIFVDSSKDPFWITYHMRKLEKSNITFYNVLIFKSINEIAHSFIKRNINFIWGKFYINYHKKYFTLMHNFYLISYFNLIKNPDSLKKLCQYLDISYTSEKFKYWVHENQTFFGSKSVYKSDIQNPKINYDSPNLKIIDKQVKEVKQKYPQIIAMESYLLNSQDHKSRPVFIRFTADLR